MGDVKGKSREMDPRVSADKRWQQIFPIPEKEEGNNVCAIGITDDVGKLII